VQPPIQKFEIIKLNAIGYMKIFTNQKIALHAACCGCHVLVGECDILIPAYFADCTIHTP
jgi:hypothetical protein